MDRPKLNYWIDVGLAVSFILSFITGIFKFPGLTKYLISIYRIVPGYQMAKIHDFSGLIMGLLVLAHLVLHRKWMAAMTKNILKKK